MGLTCQNQVLSERGSQEELKGANFSFVAPSSDELQSKKNFHGL